jgi:hypothetical protein
MCCTDLQRGRGRLRLEAGSTDLMAGWPDPAEATGEREQLGSAAKGRAHGDRRGGEDYGAGRGSREPAEEREGMAAEEGEGAGAVVDWRARRWRRRGHGGGRGIVTSFLHGLDGWSLLWAITI